MGDLIHDSGHFLQVPVLLQLLHRRSLALLSSLPSQQLFVYEFVWQQRVDVIADQDRSWLVPVGDREGHLGCENGCGWR